MNNDTSQMILESLQQAINSIERGESREAYDILAKLPPERSSIPLWWYIRGIALLNVQSLRAAKKSLEHYLSFNPTDSTKDSTIEAIEKIRKLQESPLRNGLFGAITKERFTQFDVLVNDARFKINKIESSTSNCLYQIKDCFLLAPLSTIFWSDGTILLTHTVLADFCNTAHSLLLFNEPDNTTVHQVSRILSITSGLDDAVATRWLEKFDPIIHFALQDNYDGFYYAPVQHQHVREYLVSKAIPNERVLSSEDYTVQALELWLYQTGALIV